MGKDLEAPFVNGAPDWVSLYRARGDEVSTSRPIFTGDVFTDLELPGSTGAVKKRSVIVIQHPCSMRTNGVELAWHVLAAEVSRRRPLAEAEWQGFTNLFPLPDLVPSRSGQSRHQAGDFDNLYTVPPAMLTKRIASLSPLGVNLLLQRWVHYSSRVVVPTFQFQAETVAYYEEADLVEEWCDEVGGADARVAATQCVEWLREKVRGATRQDLLKDPQTHSMIRRQMRAHIKTLRPEGATL